MPKQSPVDETAGTTSLSEATVFEDANGSPHAKPLPGGIRALAQGRQELLPILLGARFLIAT